MSKKQKVVYRTSIVINVILICVLVLGYLKMNLVHEQLFYSEVQFKLVELDGLINHQKRNNWADPNLVTTGLGDVINGIFVAKNSGKYSGWISKDERLLMEKLASALSQYPHDELYEFSKLTKEDIDRFIELQTILHEVGLGMNMTILDDWDSFIGKSEKLLELLERQDR